MTYKIIIHRSTAIVLEEINSCKINTNINELRSLRSKIFKLSSSRTIPDLITWKLIIFLVMSEKWFI